MSFPDALVVFSQTEYPEESLKFVKWWAENTQPPVHPRAAGWAYPAKASFFSGGVFSDKVSQGVLNKVLPTAKTATWPIEGMFPRFLADQRRVYHELRASGGTQTAGIDHR